MSSSLRRFEILLPLRSNDGQPIAEELLGQTIQELREQFGAVSSETQIIRGLWQHEGQVFRDELLRLKPPGVPTNTARGESGVDASLC
jgi:hypothetical protein